MNDILGEAYDPATFRKEGHALVDMIANYLQDCLDKKNMPVLPWVDANEQHQDWKAFFNDDGNVQSLYKKFLDQSNHLHHPKYIGYQVVPPLPMAALSDLLAAFSNNGNWL